ncbi:MAG: hypothetical protein ACFFBD_09725 [Candidatus Hodarchaeota archaeon]
MSRIPLVAPPLHRPTKAAEFREIQDLIENFRCHGALSIFTAVSLKNLGIPVEKERY